MPEITLPPITIEHPEVGPIAARLAKLNDEYAAARSELADLEARRPLALRADRQSYADAMRDGKPDPGGKKLVAHDAKLEAARRRVEALELAVIDEERALA